ncbi:MAG: DUF429 domain-containing protein [Anaerolineales bacterium]|jgi:hypothetical protein
MLFANMTFIGIDPTAGQRPFSYAALDGDLQMLALGQGSMDDVLAFVAGQRQAFVAVNAPTRPNQGLLADPQVRQSLNPPPRPGRWLDFRIAEYLLRQHNISIPQTPAKEQESPNWMQMGFKLYRRLELLDYRPYHVDGARRQFMEIYPHASFTMLLGVLPFPKHTLEGRIQRQLILYASKVNVPDAMLFFEEITRYRLLNGILPSEDLFTPGELDALVAAYSAWLAGNQPDQVCLIGDPREGQIVLPGELKPRY